MHRNVIQIREKREFPKANQNGERAPTILEPRPTDSYFPYFYSELIMEIA